MIHLYFQLLISGRTIYKFFFFLFAIFNLILYISVPLDNCAFPSNYSYPLRKRLILNWNTLKDILIIFNFDKIHFTTTCTLGTEFKLLRNCWQGNFGCGPSFEQERYRVKGYRINYVRSLFLVLSTPLKLTAWMRFFFFL